jgi:hypothetical protein
MAAVSCLTLTVVHPGVGFGGVWREADIGVGLGREKEARRV